MPDVPTTDEATDSAMAGLKTGGAAAAGETVGRAVLGPGLGTAAGGAIAAAFLDGNRRDIAASMAVERGANELMSGAAQASNQNSGRGVK